jgi:hypothetical protein
LAFVAFSGLLFEFLTPSPLEGHNFFNFIMFLTIFYAQEVLIAKGFKFGLNIRNSGTLPLLALSI